MANPSLAIDSPIERNEPMSRTFLAACAALTLLGLAVGSADAGPATLAEAKALAAQQSKPLLLDFFTEW